ncbi:metallophosphoesterase family protein [Caenimonas sedimenti]|uniref:Metallophosphoesterase family protein n=1 Tax=Caenimonas sedimenti TaxID=2596921 RepID=A0A562ZQV3_9BURK|nr:metallophosphoesterase family protein [Caenimonas sedimenti]TWO70979.1 metallophosphoesterase family protein [Caenimonas sedimenti]
MKLAAISDIHGNLSALEAVLDDIAAQEVDQIVNLGDILSGPLQPAETAGLLMAKGFPTIAGNHERQLLRLRDTGAAPDLATSDGYTAAQLTDEHWTWLRGLPPVLQLSQDVLLVHGTPSSDLLYWLETATPGFGRDGSNGLRAATDDEVRARLGETRASLILCGHTHVARAVQCGGSLVVNPGSVGLQAFHWDQPHDHHVENGTPHARYALLEQRAQGWTARLCAVPYAWEPQSRLAAERGRPDWAYALATGRMPPRPATIAA